MEVNYEEGYINFSADWSDNDDWDEENDPFSGWKYKDELPSFPNSLYENNSASKAGNDAEQVDHLDLVLVDGRARAHLEEGSPVRLNDHGSLEGFVSTETQATEEFVASNYEANNDAGFLKCTTAPVEMENHEIANDLAGHCILEGPQQTGMENTEKSLSLPSGPEPLTSNTTLPSASDIFPVTEFHEVLKEAERVENVVDINNDYKTLSDEVASPSQMLQDFVNNSAFELASDGVTVMDSESIQAIYLPQRKQKKRKSSSSTKRTGVLENSGKKHFNFRKSPRRLIDSKSSSSAPKLKYSLRSKSLQCLQKHKNPEFAGLNSTPKTKGKEYIFPHCSAISASTRRSKSLRKTHVLISSKLPTIKHGVYPKHHKCDLCNKLFRYKCVLRNHVKVQHENFRYECLQCPKTYMDKRELSYHLSTQHNTGSALVCELCGKKFGIASHLKRHVITHSTERTEKCERCGKRFRRPDHLSRHLKRQM